MGLDMARLGARAKGLVRAGGEVLWPSRSLVSGARDIGQGALSPQEFAALNFIASPVCHTCGQPQEVDLGPLAQCGACLARPPKWDAARSALVYDEASRRIVLDLKRAGRRDGLSVMANWMVQAARPLLEETDLIVPVPLHYRRLASRGFNQSGWLAAGMARQTGLVLRVDILKRAKSTPSQGGMSPKARKRNVAGAFAVRHGKSAALEDRHVLLVDDVLTTGATLEACVRPLRKAGVRAVQVVTLARVVRARDASI
ncbi:MAG: ComF family protein [Hyphomonadaceae bacterium]|nr:ComF family protein [Hyphomonadaceae bacterium]